MKKRYAAADILRGIGISLVILGHAIIYYPINLHENPYCEVLFSLVNSIHLALLFAVSGFCFSFTGSYGKFVLKKIQRLMIPYVFFNLLDIVPRAFLTAFVNRPRDIGSSIYKIILEGGEYWFLYTLFLIFLLFPLISQAAQSLKGQVLVLILAAGMRFTASSMPDTLMLSSVFRWLLCFYVGYLVKIHLEEMSCFLNSLKRGVRYGTAVYVSLTVWILFFCCAVYADIGLTAAANTALYMLCTLSGMVFAALLAVKYSKSVVFSPFCSFGKVSLQLYLLNGFLLVGARTLIVSILGITNAAAVICFNLFVTLIVSYFIISKILSRFAVIRFLCGM